MTKDNYFLVSNYYLIHHYLLSLLSLEDLKGVLTFKIITDIYSTQSVY